MRFVHTSLLAMSLIAVLSGSASIYAAALTWHGASAPPSSWDIGTTANWNGSTTTYNNITPDSVTFDGTAASYTVNVITTVSPLSMAISSSGSAYTFSGASISGATSIVKTGTATATFTQPSIGFTGGTKVNSASIIDYSPTSGSSHSFGSGTIELNLAGARFDYNPTVVGSTLSNNFNITANGVQWRSPANPLNTYSGTVTLGADITLGSHPETRGKLRESVILTGDRTISGSSLTTPVISGQVTSSGPKRTLTISNNGDNPGWFIDISSPGTTAWDIKDLVLNDAGNREATTRVTSDERNFFTSMEANGGYLKILTAGVQFARAANAEIGFDIIIKPQTAGTGTEYGTGIRGNTGFTVVSGGGLHGTGIYRSGAPSCCNGGGQEFKNPLDVTVTGTGLISPGDPTLANTAGVLTLTGNLAFSGGKLQIDVLTGNGVAGTDFDRMVVQDSLVASGRGSVTGISSANLVIDFHNVSFADLQGDTIVFLTSSLTNFSGQQFGSVADINNGGYWYQVAYGNGFIALTSFVSTVPEPSTFALIGLGLVGMSVRARRRRRAAA